MQSDGERNYNVILLDGFFLEEHMGDSSTTFAFWNSFHFLDFPNFSEI